MTMVTPRLIMPPAKPYRRLGSWSVFERRFEPLPNRGCDVLWDIGSLPPPPLDCREWWTVLDSEGRLITAAGLHLVNRFAYIRCRNLWGGEWHDHPEYRYD